MHVSKGEREKERICEAYGSGFSDRGKHEASLARDALFGRPSIILAGSERTRDAGRLPR